MGARRASQPHHRRLLSLIATFATIPFTASDGVKLQTTLTGEGKRPVIVEFSPYGRNSGTIEAGPAYNYLLVQIRGTGDSDGVFDALGARTQQDVVEVLDWACKQPWSSGKLGLNGFSASAITIYNSLHLELPCVKTAVLRSGTFELYRDLLSPGGISNLVPGAGVLGLIGAPAAAQGPDRPNPLGGVDTTTGLIGAGLSGLEHETLDDWWRERGFRGDVNHLPILMINGFFDVESRGAFEGYERLKRDGARLIVVGAHDGAPVGTRNGVPDAKKWFDRYVRGVRKRFHARPRVKLLLSDGDREDYLGGKFIRRKATDWPPPKTRWIPLALSSAGTLETALDEPATTQSYAAVPSSPTASDVPNAAIVGAAGFNQLSTAFPALTDMNATDSQSLTYTTAPLSRNVVAVGPADLQVRLSSTASETGIWAVVSDVSPDGTAHPLAVGRLLNAFPDINRGRSLKDPTSGAIVQPFGKYDVKQPAPPGEERLYHVELWPIGNRFRAGHRIRLHILGASAASRPGAPAVNTVAVGGADGSRLLFPVLGERGGLSTIVTRANVTSHRG